jgi:hypothetical protein
MCPVRGKRGQRHREEEREREREKEKLVLFVFWFVWFSIVFDCLFCFVFVVFHYQVTSKFGKFLTLELSILWFHFIPSNCVLVDFQTNHLVPFLQNIYCKWIFLSSCGEKFLGTTPGSFFSLTACTIQEL